MTDASCFIISRGNLRKVTADDPNGSHHVNGYDKALGLCSDGHAGCYVLQDDSLFRIDESLAKIESVSTGWSGTANIFGMCSDAGSGCFIITGHGRLWHVTPESPEGVYWSSGWVGGAAHTSLFMCPHRSGCFVLNPASGNLWQIAHVQGQIVTTKWSAGWTGGHETALGWYSGICEDGNDGCFVVGGAGNLYHVTEEDKEAKKEESKWSGPWTDGKGGWLGGMCWDGSHGCFIVSGAGNVWHATPAAKDGGRSCLSKNWHVPNRCMASCRTACTSSLPSAGSVTIANKSANVRVLRFYPAFEETCGEPIKELEMQPGEEKEAVNFPYYAWMRMYDASKAHILQRSYVAAGQRIVVEDSPVNGFQVLPQGISFGHAVVAAGGPPNGREIWMGCEYLGIMPGDDAGAFHWGLVVGAESDEVAFAWEVTGQGGLDEPMCVVGPKPYGPVACSPELKEPPTRQGRTLLQYGPGPADDGTKTGGYILLPERTTKTDAEIAHFTKGWVQKHPRYHSISINCQHYCEDLYGFLIGQPGQFPYRQTDKTNFGAIYINASQLPHYQCTFKWTCRA